MAVMPSGMLSFLYNVMNDTEMNQRFRDEPHEVMEFFELTDRQRKLIEDAGMALLKKRVEREADWQKRTLIAEADEKAADQDPNPDTGRQKRIAATLQKFQLFKDTFRATETNETINEVYGDPTPWSYDGVEEYPNFKAAMDALILYAMEKELEKSYGRFW